MRRTRDSALLGGFLVLLAGLLNTAPLYVPGVMLLLVALVCEGWVRAAQHEIVVERDVEQTRVAEDQGVQAQIVVSAGIGFPAGHLSDPFLGTARVPLHAGRRLQRLRVRAEFARRGLRTFAPATVEVRDPLGMASRSVVTGEPFQLLVVPRIEPLQAAGAVGRDAASTLLRGLASAAGADVDGLRRHRPGAPASRIYWQGLARGGELSERRVSHGSDARVLVVLDARAASADDLDAAVRAAASVTAHFGARAGCQLALPGRRRVLSVGPALRAWDAALGELALVQAGAGPAPGLIAAQHGLVILVSGARTPDLALVDDRHGRGTRIVVSPGAVPEGHTAAFSVSGCSAYLLQARAPRTASAAR